MQAFAYLASLEGVVLEFVDEEHSRSGSGEREALAVARETV